ncbi:MAG: D-alanyl-D-alanine carboxypeptidase/D-alanyl-D-alanine-endopeptidase [Gammaproteobacteria bacterium]|nr:D-alanyl-D-alanine carboxypeptidase/D-alanyl-D-alanine-endopeptidase [Gammaproteobacteria bacterium]
MLTTRHIRFNVRVVLCLLFSLCAHAAADLPPILAQTIADKGFELDGIGLFVQEVGANKPLVSFQAHKPFNPASVIKLVTTAASLGTLGVGYRWSTDVLYTGDLNRGTLNGDVYFVGNGDPYLTPERFWLLLNRLSMFGIHDIKGNVYFDDSYFRPDKVDYGAFDDQPFRTYHVGPNAVLVGFQATEFHFGVEQDQVNIVTFPASPRLRLVNKVKLVNGSCGNWQKRLTLSVDNKGDDVVVTFDGRYARECERRTLYRRVVETADHFSHYFLPIWQQLGGSVGGRIQPARVPSSATSAIQESSISLAEAIRLINKFSNNVMTRQVLLTMGAARYQAPGTTDKGLKAVRSWVQETGVDDSVLQLDNGAGLSRDTRTSAVMLGQMLVYIYHQAYMPEFMASLPVSGYDGTMAHRFHGEPLIGRAHIKTGLLDFVQTMAGYVYARSGKRYVVVMLHNDKQAHTKKAEALQDELIRWVYQQ